MKVSETQRFGTVYEDNNCVLKYKWICLYWVDLVVSDEYTIRPDEYYKNELFLKYIEGMTGK